MIQTPWGFEAYFSSYRSNTRGVAIVNDAFSDTYCDSVTLDVTIDNENYLQVNVYRTNEENPQFYKNIRKKLKQLQITTRLLLWLFEAVSIFSRSFYP